MISTSEYTTDNRDNNIYSCNSCDTKFADIFQDEGNYCLDCWQRRTYPRI